MVDAITVGILFVVGLAGVAAIVFWEKIIKWAQEALFPWFREHLPTLEPYVRQAFVALNRVVGAIRRTAIEAWRKVRQFLLKQIVRFERTAANTYVRKITSYLREKLEGDLSEVIVRTTEQRVSLDDLPSDVQEAFLRGSMETEFDITSEQDEQVEQALAVMALS